MFLCFPDKPAVNGGGGDGGGTGNSSATGKYHKYVKVDHIMMQHKLSGGGTSIGSCIALWPETRPPGSYCELTCKPGSHYDAGAYLCQESNLSRGRIEHFFMLMMLRRLQRHVVNQALVVRHCHYYFWCTCTVLNLFAVFIL